MKKIVLIIMLFCVCCFGADSVVTIAASGAMYTKLKTAVDANRQDVTSFGAGDNLIFYIIGNFVDSVGASEVWFRQGVGYYQTDADNYIILYTADSCRSDGVWNDAKYQLGSTSYAMNIGADLKIHIHGLQIRALGTTGNSTIANYGDSTRFYDCIIRNDGTETGNRFAFRTYGADNVFYIYNNLIYDFNNQSSSSGIYDLESGDSSVYLYNNTISNCTYGVYTIANKVVAKNNIFWGCTTPVRNVAFGTGTDWNSTDSSTLAYSNSGSNDSTSAVYSFTNSGADDWTLTSEFAGTDLSSDSHLPFSTDIQGDTRTDPWDMGFDEYISAGVSYKGQIIFIQGD